MKLRKILPSLIVFAIGIPLCLLFSQAVTTSEKRRFQEPLIAVLGYDTYHSLIRGHRTPSHYLGNTLLAPDFLLTDQFGREFQLRSLPGKLTVMNFWTITCQPCVEEIPSFIRLDRIAKARGDFDVITVCADKDWNTIKHILPPNSRLKVVFDPDRRIITGKYGTRLFPETWIIDARGVIRLRIDGPRDWSDALSLELIEMFQ